MIPEIMTSILVRASAVPALPLLAISSAIGKTITCVLVVNPVRYRNMKSKAVGIPGMHSTADIHNAEMMHPTLIGNRRDCSRFDSVVTKGPPLAMPMKIIEFAIAAWLELRLNTVFK